MGIERACIGYHESFSFCNRFGGQIRTGGGSLEVTAFSIYLKSVGVLERKSTTDVSILGYWSLGKTERLGRIRATDNMPGWRNGRRCGLKILSTPSYLVLPDDTTQYLSTFQPSKQAHVLPGITR